MVKVGRHERTRRAITTHTGGNADDAAAVSALLRAHGAIEVADIVELAETLAAFQTAQRPAGRRLAVITSSGGLAELILDVAAENRYRAAAAVARAEGRDRGRDRSPLVPCCAV